MFESDEQIESRLTDSRNLARVESLYRGGKTHGSQIPEFLRVIAGVSARTNGTRETAKALEISEQHTNTLRKGRTDPKNLNPDLANKIDNLAGSIRDTALDKLADVLGIMDVPNESADLKLPQKVAVARDLATIVDKLNPKAGEGGTQIGTFIVYAPPPLEPDKLQFPVIEVETK